MAKSLFFGVAWGWGLSLVNSLQFQENINYSVVCENGREKCSLVEGMSSSSLSKAYGVFNNEVEKDGWGKLWVHGKDGEGWYQSGFLEGSLTSTQIYQHYISWYQYTFGTTPITPKTVAFIMDQYQYSLDLVKNNPNDSYYIRLGEVMDQMQGVLDGINYAAEKNQTLSLLDVLLLQAAGDLFDIIPAMNLENLHLSSLSKLEFFERWHESISCSALIKMSPNKDDVYVAHTTWSSYQNMLRIFKNYDMNSGSYQVSYSGRPGMIYSKDDFYVLPHDKQQLTVLETTNGILSDEMYSKIVPTTLLTWQRIPLTNSIATNGQSWTELFGRHNSGTYANQWMVVDWKEFTPFVGPNPSNFLWITEVAPEITAALDVTSQFLALNGGEWPSYNIPYQEEVYVQSGFQDAYIKYGDDYSFENCTRAKIFQRDAPFVTTEKEMMKMIRLNQWQTDPLSQGDAHDAISSRKDLQDPSKGKPKSFGGIDGKISSYSRMMNRNKKQEALFTAQCGPSTDDQPVFQWSSTQWNSLIHDGQPDTFNFPWVEMDFYAH